MAINTSIQEAFCKYFQILLSDYQVYMIDSAEGLKMDDICFDTVSAARSFTMVLL